MRDLSARRLERKKQSGQVVHVDFGHRPTQQFIAQ